MTPYTREAIATIRNAINGGQPADHVRQQLGWSGSMFDRVCRDHGIDARAQGVAHDEIALPAPRTDRPGALPPEVKCDRRIVSVPIALNPDQIAKIERYAARAGVNRHRGAGAIVGEYVATVGVTQIQFVKRAPHGEGRNATVVAIGVDSDVWTELHQEARRRQIKGATVGALVKACIVRYFDGVHE